MGRFRMGFKPKSGKVYDLSKTLKILKQEGFENYTTKEVAGGYMIIKEEERKEIEKQNRWKQQEFKDKINGGGKYQDIKLVPCQYDCVQKKKKEEFTR